MADGCEDVKAEGFKKKEPAGTKLVPFIRKTSFEIESWESGEPTANRERASADEDEVSLLRRLVRLSPLFLCNTKH